MSLQNGFQSMSRSSLPSSSPSISQSDSSSGKGSSGRGEEGSEKTRSRGFDGGQDRNDGCPKPEDTTASGEGGGQFVSQAPPTLMPQVLGTMRMAPTMVTNVVRPIASTPIPIASKPVDSALTVGPLPQDKKTTLLIGGGGAQQLPITAGGGYLSSCSSPNPFSANARDGSGLVTSLVLGGSLPAAQPVQLLAPQPLPLHAQSTPLPVLPKPLVQYILPNESPASPQILSLPTTASMSNGVHSGAGLRVASVSPGTRGETQIGSKTEPPKL